MRPGDKPLRKQMRGIVEGCALRAAHAAGLPEASARALSNAAGRDFIDRYDPGRFRNTTGREITRLMRERAVLIDGVEFGGPLGRDHTTGRERGGAMHVGRYDLSLTANRRFQAWTEAWAVEALRVLKPGGHLLAFCGTRTYHRLAAGVEDAGFEVRDTIAWMYGSGFPKSLDVSKAIDNRRDDEPAVRVVCRWLRASIEASPLTVRDVAEAFGFNPRMVEHWAARDTDSQPTLPTLEQWDALRELLAFDEAMDAEVLRLNLRKGEPGEAWADRPVTGTVAEWADRTNYALTSRDGLRRDEPARDAARAWQGWGTALKPAFEPIIVARKPLAGTVAGNVLEHGTGALNVDGCRIGFADDEDERESKDKNRHQDFGSGPRENAVFGADTRDRGDYDPPGRWPANVVLDEAAGAMLDEQTGEPTETGGASRFFYCAKTSSRERNAGLEAFDEQHKPTWSSGEASPGTFQTDGTRETARNVHPTVKPIDLMRWLVRLVNAPGGLVLDPFAGSGTTGCAAVLEGFQFIGCERDPEYAAIAEARIAWWAKHRGEGATDDVLAVAEARDEIAGTGQLSLMGEAA